MDADVSVAGGTWQHPGQSTKNAAGQLGGALDRARAGVPLVTALQQVADRTSVDALARTVNGLFLAITRATVSTM